MSHVPATGRAPGALPAFPTNDAGWARYFDEFAPRYEASAFGGAGLAYVGAHEIAAVTGALDGVAPGRVLDAGAGSGRIARVLAARGWAVTALDVSAEMLDRLGRDLPDAECIQAALGSPLPLDDASVDAVVSMRVLKYVGDLAGALTELARVVRPGGTVVLELANRRSAARFGYRGAPVHLRTIRGFEWEMRAAGLQPLRRVAGTRLPQPLWSRARGAGIADLAVACERAAAVLLGGNRTAAGARSVVVVGRRA